MSGPIIRKYGFPNFEAIFGQRDVPHGTADTEGKPPTQIPTDPSTTTTPTRDDPGSPPGADATPEEKASEDSAQL